MRQVPPIEWIIRIIDTWDESFEEAKDPAQGRKEPNASAAPSDSAPSAGGAVLAGASPAAKLRQLAQQAIEQGVRLPTLPTGEDRTNWARWIEECDALLDQPMGDLWRWRLPAQV